MELRPVLPRDQRIHRHYLLFAMDRQLEPIRQQGLQHHRYLLPGRAGRYRGDDIVSFGVEPGRPGDLVRFHAIRPGHDTLQRDVGKVNPTRVAAHGHTEVIACRRRGGLDRHYIE